MIPAGYVVVETDERVEDWGRRFLTRWGARKITREHPPIVPSYHLRVERRGLFDWRVVAYQNRLERRADRPPTDPGMATR